MKRVLSLVLALVMVLGMIPTFAAEMTGGEHLLEHGFITGKPGDDVATKLDAGAALTRQELAALIAELMGEKEIAAVFAQPADYADADKIGAWAVPFVAYAQVNGWMSGKPGNMFDPTGPVPGQQLAAVLMNALGYTVDTQAKYATVIADAAALGIAVSSSNLTRGQAFEAMWTAVSEVNVNGEEQTLGQKLGKLEAPVTELKMTAAMAGVKKVNVTFNQAVDTTKAVVRVKKGAAIYSGTVTWNEAKTIASVATVIALPAGDYTVEVTGLEKDLTGTFTVVAEAASSIEFSTTTLDDATAAARVPFAVKNQYGEEMNVFANSTGVVVSIYNVTQNAAVAPLLVGANKYFEINTAAVADDFKTGDVVRVIVSYAGLTAQANLTVQQPAIAGTMSFGELVLAKDDVRLNVADGTVKMAYVLLDQYGQAMKLTDVAAQALPATLNGVQFVSSNAAVISHVGVVTVDKVSYLQFTVAGDGVATITAIVNASGNVASTQITVAKNGTPTAAVISAPTMLVASQDKAFDLAMVITDQYGDVIKSVADITVVKVDNGLIDNEAVVTASADANGATKLTVDLTGLADATVDVTKTFVINVTNTASGAVIGSVSIVIEPEAEVSYIDSINFPTTFEVLAQRELKAADIKAFDQYGRAISAAGFTVARKVPAETVFTSADGATTFIAGAAAGTQVFTVTLDGKTKDMTLNVVASSAVKTYAIQTIAPIYKAVANAAYNVNVLLAGKTEAGVEVVLASETPQIVTTSNPAVVLVDGTAIRGQAVGTATISAWLGGKVVATQEVTVTDAAPVATTITITATASAGVTTLDSLVTVKDQYGVAFATDPGTYLVNGSVVAAGSTMVAGVQEVTFVANNGITKTVEVTVTP